MKARAVPYILTAILIASGIAPGWAQDADESAIRTRIIALEHVWNLAEASKDMKALDTLFDNAMVYVDGDGSLMTKAAFLSHVKSSHVAQVVTQSMTVQVFGSAAIVTGTHVASEFKNGKVIVRRSRFIDTWVFLRQAWVCVAAQDTPIGR
jgi:hypothetical protein